MKQLSHLERLAVIHRPFPRRTLPVSYPWSGTITANQFARTIEDLDKEAKELTAYVRRMRRAFEEDLPEPDMTDAVLNADSVWSAIAAFTAEGYTAERIANYYSMSIHRVMQIQMALKKTPLRAPGAHDYKGLR